MNLIQQDQVSIMMKPMNTLEKLELKLSNTNIIKIQLILII